MRLQLTPRDTSFFDLLTESAQHLVIGANLLRDLIPADRSERKAIFQRINEAEREADEVTRRIMHRLNQTFVPPLDRDDIYLLARGPDDSHDHLERAAAPTALHTDGVRPPRAAQAGATRPLSVGSPRGLQLVGLQRQGAQAHHHAFVGFARVPR